MTHHPSVTALALIVTGAIIAGGARGQAGTPRFYADDPVWVHPDTQDAGAMTPNEVDLRVDVTYNLLTGRRRAAGLAANVNTVDEVPDSSWFTNRSRRAPLTPARVLQGPNTTRGPRVGPWTITSSKTDGVTPGFTVKDADGQRWFLKFDPPGLRGMTTGTEVTVTKLMWALGYNVPENHVARVRRDDLVVGEGATFTASTGIRRAMRQGDLDSLLARAARDADGTYRVVASKALAGTPVGRIRFTGTRADDPNDLVAHEDRRELRAYGVFASWLNHVDAKATNSLDTLVREGGRTVVRHHLIDFGSALGSGGVAPADHWAGAEYLFDGRRALLRAAALGFAVPGWRSAAFFEAPSIGRLPLHPENFDPATWRPRVPNRAFLQARADDRFWAARQLARLDRPILEAAIGAGEFGDPAAEAFLLHTLEVRRRTILQRYLIGINPLVDANLDNEVLTLENAAVSHGDASAPAEYVVQWFEFDNLTQVLAPIGVTRGNSTRLAVPAGLSDHPGRFVTARVHAEGTPHATWQRPADFYFRHAASGWQLVGVDREPGV